MALTRYFKQTLIERVERDPVNATLGFEQLAATREDLRERWQ